MRRASSKLTWTLLVLIAAGAARPVAAQNAQAVFDRLISDAFQAQRDGRWADMERCLLQAAELRLRPLNEWQLRGLSWVLRVQKRPQEALPVAEYNHKTNCCSASLQELVATYIDLDRYADARNAISAWIRAGRPGDAAEARQGLDVQVGRVGIIYQCAMIRLDLKEQPKDVRDWVRQLGGWDLLIPVDTDWAKVAVYVTNLRSHTIHSDAGENRWLRIVPVDLEQPVMVSLVTKHITTIVDLDVVDTEPYVVPERYRQYLGRTGPFEEEGQGIDPTTPLARTIAASLKGKTTVETVRNTWQWWTDCIEYGDADDSGNDSERALRTRTAVCHGMAQAACALLRANGLATRLIRGRWHTWAEVWLPKVGWLPFQNDVRLGQVGGGWNALHAAAEPFDWPKDGRHSLSTQPAFNVDWFWGGPCAEIRTLRTTVEDLPVEQVAREAGIAGQLVP